MASLIWGDIKVRGSFVTDVFCTVKTNRTGHTVRIEYSPNHPPTPIVHGLPVVAWLQVRAGEAPVAYEDVSVAMSRSGGADVLTVSTLAWRVEAAARPIWRSTTPGKKQIDLSFQPLRDPLSPMGASSEVVAPHGLIGQSYDGDAIAVDGKQDHYRELWKAQGAGKEIITQAQAQGAIEGEGADYKVSDFFATDFKYSRYAVAAAAPRDIAALSGFKRKISTQFWSVSAGASGDDSKEALDAPAPAAGA